MNFNLFNKVVGENFSTMAEASAAKITNTFNVSIEFTGQKFDLSKGYPYIY
mgnify:CR=1